MLYRVCSNKFDEPVFAARFSMEKWITKEQIVRLYKYMLSKHKKTLKSSGNNTRWHGFGRDSCFIIKGPVNRGVSESITIPIFEFPISFYIW